MLGKRNGGDQRLDAISLHPGRRTLAPNELTRRGIWEPLPVKPFLFTRLVAVDRRMPFEAKQSLVEDDVVRGFGVTPSDVEVVNRCKIVLDDEEGHFGYVVGATKFDIGRHNNSGTVQNLYLFGIAPDNRVLFFGQFRPLNIDLPLLDRDEARQIPGLQQCTDSDFACTAIELVGDSGDDVQISNMLEALARSEKLGGGQFVPSSVA